MRSILLSLSFLLSSGLLASATFEAGLEFKSKYRTGQVRALCPGISRHYYCQSEELAPNMGTYLVSSETVDADRFKVIATWRDGRTVTKSGVFKDGKSERINLWIRSLFQTPLLNHGKNIIDYQLMKGGENVDQGQFEVMVEEESQIHCAPGSVHYFNDRYCDNPSRVCRDYFSRDYCSK